MGRASLKVLYIAGSGRSGSTILDNILGQLDGFASVGEARFLWERGMIEDRTCACGTPFSSCPFWQAVLREAFDGAMIDPQRMLALLRRGTRARHIPAMVGGGERRARFMDGLDELPQRLTTLYQAIAAQSDAKVIVDSSKLPTYGSLLDRLPDLDLHVVHLVRDPRATAYSWRRKKSLPDKQGATMQRQGALKASALWTLWNTAPQMFWRASPRYLRVRYEDFVDAPRATVERICGFVGEEPSALPFISDAEVELAPGHSVAGNPSRFTTGVVPIRPDDEWRSRMRRRDRWLVTSVTWPLLLQLRYPLA
jgi:hypothetical protein